MAENTCDNVFGTDEVEDTVHLWKNLAGYSLLVIGDAGIYKYMKSGIEQFRNTSMHIEWCCSWQW